MASSPTSPANLKKLSKIAEVAQDLDPKLTVSQLGAILFIARNPGCYQGDLIDKLGWQTSAVSRFVTEFGTKPYDRFENPYGILDKLDDPKDQRLKPLYLTPKGQAFVGRMAAALE